MAAGKLRMEKAELEQVSVCVRVCTCVRGREGEGEGERERDRERETIHHPYRLLCFSMSVESSSIILT